jgi:hypothetical protein
VKRRGDPVRLPRNLRLLAPLTFTRQEIELPGVKMGVSPINNHAERMIRSEKGTMQLNFIDKIVERGIIFLLIFTPLAFGTIQEWSIAVMEIVAFSIFFLYLIKNILDEKPFFDDPPAV